MEDNYSKRELDHYFEEIKTHIKDFREENQKDMAEINERVKITNGKVKLHTKILLIVGAVLATLLITNGDEKIIKIINLFL